MTDVPFPRIAPGCIVGSTTTRGDPVGRRPPEPGWEDEPTAKVRVLLECPSSSSPSLIAGMLERHGYGVRVCEGPDRRHACPLLDGGTCGLVNGADVVVNLLQHGPEPEARQVLGALSDERRPPAIVAELSRPELARRDRSGDPGFHRDRVSVVHSPMTSATLLAALDDALRHRHRAPPVWGDGFC